MIPLIYILPTEDVYTEMSGVVTKITPAFSHYRHSVQIEFKYNLDEYFTIEIGLSEFDQPETVSLYGYYGSTTISVSDLQDSYSLTGKKVSVMLSKDVILDIVNNAVTIDGFETGTTITFNGIQDKNELSTRAKLSKFVLGQFTATMTINGVSYTYKRGTKKTSYQPVLISQTSKKIPDAVDGIYNIYHLDGSNDGLSLVILPQKSFVNHYLFRQEPQLKNIVMNGEDHFTAGTIDTFENNGVIEVNGKPTSMQKFLIAGKDKEFKTFVFNASRDKNLYTEISLLFPAVQHSSMTVYDMNENLLIKGRVSYLGKFDKEEDKLVNCILMTDCHDFFGRRINREYEFKYIPESVTSKRFASITNASEIGTLYVRDVETGDEDIVPLDTRDLSVQKDGYLTASNNNVNLSINKERLLSETRKMRGTQKTFKRITSDDYMAPLYRFETLDFEEEEITVSNGTLSVTKPISEKSALVLADGSSRIVSREQLTEFGGITLAIAPDRITTKGIDISNFSDYALLCRLTETPEYGVAGVRRGTRELMYTLTLEYAFTDITMIYNVSENKVYYTNFARKEVVDSAADLDGSFTPYISSVDENLLKKFLFEGTIGSYKVVKTPNSSLVTLRGDGIFAEDLTHEKYIDGDYNIASISSLSGELVDIDDAISDNGRDTVYVPRPSSTKIMKSTFGSMTTTFRKVANGVYSNKEASIKSVTLDSGSYTLVLTVDGVDKTVVLENTGGAIEIRKGLKKSVFSTDEAFDSMEAYTLSTDIMFDKTFQYFSMFVLEADLDVSIALDLGVVNEMISTGTVGIMGTISLSYDNKMFMFTGMNASSMSVSGSTLTSGSDSIDMDVSTGVAKAFSFDGEDGDVTTTVSGTSYSESLTEWPSGHVQNNGFFDIDEFSSGSIYGISFAIEKAQHLQIKE